MADENANLKQVGDFLAELDTIERDVRDKVAALDRARRNQRLAVHQAEWHIRGITYHCRRLAKCYRRVAQGAADRAVGTDADVIVMYAPAIQEMWFEFYALISLARIALDRLRNLLRPIFATEFNRLPKSISGYLNGGTNCPVYEWLAEQPTVEYLCDIRNCIVHFRTFATGDNAMIVKEGLDENEFGEMAKSDWIQPIGKRCVSARG